MEREIKDSGEQRQFETGAHRDNAANKGRCDLLPMKEVAAAYNAIENKRYSTKIGDVLLLAISCFSRIEPQKTEKVVVRQVMREVAGYAIVAAGIEENLVTNDLQSNNGAIGTDNYFWYGAIQVSKHYEAGGKKYGYHNWKKGMPLTVYADSCMRHLMKSLAGMDDEYHIRAAAWNALCFLYTLENNPSLDDWCARESEQDETR